MSRIPVYLRTYLNVLKRWMLRRVRQTNLLSTSTGMSCTTEEGDLWLLSKAANQADEALGLFSGVFAAYYRRFKYIVLIIDACRVPPNNLQFANMAGGSIFPNASTDGDAKAVDRFFAATLRDPALEVDLQSVLCSTYTLQLIEFLRGMQPTLLEMTHAPDALPKVVCPRPFARLSRLRFEHV